MSSPLVMPSPAFVSTITRCPAATYSRTASGVSPTRYSCVLISLGTPTSMAHLHIRLCHAEYTHSALVSRRSNGQNGALMQISCINLLDRKGIRHGTRFYRSPATRCAQHRWPRHAPATRRVDRPLPHRDRTAAARAGGNWPDPRLSCRPRSGAAWLWRARAYPHDAGKPEPRADGSVRGGGGGQPQRGPVRVDERARRLSGFGNGALARSFCRGSPRRAGPSARRGADGIGLCPAASRGSAAAARLGRIAAFEASWSEARHMRHLRHCPE